MSDEELLKIACENAGSFPANSIRSITSKQHLEGYRKRLHDHAGRLFWEDGKASLDIWEYNDTFAEFQNTNVTSTAELKGRLVGAQLFIHDDPRCRFLFIHARNSREKLKISREMFTFALTYYQVMPSFLDFVFPFGHQHFAEDFHFSGFREDTRLLPSDEALKILDLGRSGREVRLCYSLKSVEPNDFKTEWPWAVRQVAVYHSFDLETGKAFWIVIKGGHLIRDRVKSATDPASTGAPDLKSSLSTSSLFAATLGTHLILCDWCDEDWRWYLTFLEKRFQELTRPALAVDIPKAPSFVEPATYQKVEQQPTVSFRGTVSGLARRTPSAREARRIASSFRRKTRFRQSFPQPAMPMSEMDQSIAGFEPVPPPGVGGANVNHSSQRDEVFSGRRLQQVQEIEDKTNEVTLILEANLKIVKSILNHYLKLIASDSCPMELKTDCKVQITQFERRIDNIVGDLEIQHSSAQTLLRLVENRKGLLSGLLNLSNIEANRDLGSKSQRAAKKMEAMTEQMHLLAVKTKQETVSMKIITLVTLFFLPGTFIATIMSTDIVKFPSPQESGKVFQLGALQLYLAITLPITAVTFAAWLFFYLYVNRRQQFKEYGGKFIAWLP